MPKAEEMRSQQTHGVIRGAKALLRSLIHPFFIPGHSTPSSDLYWERSEKLLLSDTELISKYVLLS